MRGRLRFLLACCCVFFCVPIFARADRTKLEKPVPVSFQKTDKAKVSGKVEEYDEQELQLTDSKNTLQHVRWDEMDAKTAYGVWQKLLGPKDAKGYLSLGKTMLGLEGGQSWADKAFAIAVKIDPTVKDEVEQAKKDASDAGKEKDKPGGDKNVEDDKDKKPERPRDGDARRPGRQGGDGKPDGERRGDGEDDANNKNPGGPQVIGEAEKKFWGKLSDDEQAQSVKQLEAFAEDSAKKLNCPLRKLETKYFLFYSDLPGKEASNWAGLLDRMYDRLAVLFAVEKGANVWRGKALVFVFSKKDDYRRFQQTMHKTDAGGSAGMCHCFGDGIVHIAFYRQPSELDFAHVLVHESVHGFIHRYKSPVSIPSWANEGLAEVIADELVPQPQRAIRSRQQLAKELIGAYGKGSLGDFLEADHIQAWHYPVAETLCAYMISQSKKGYVDFINGIKEGLTWEQSLEQRYKAPRGRLVSAYGMAIGLKSLQE